MLDGVYWCGADGAPAFLEVDAPTDDELHALLQAAITKLMKLLTRRGGLVEDMGQTNLADADADADEARTLRPLQAAAACRIAFGPRAGQRLKSLQGWPCGLPASLPVVRRARPSSWATRRLAAASFGPRNLGMAGAARFAEAQTPCSTELQS